MPQTSLFRCFEGQGVQTIAIYEGSEGRGAPDIVICDTLRASRLLGGLLATGRRLLRDSFAAPLAEGPAVRRRAHFGPKCCK